MSFLVVFNGQFTPLLQTISSPVRKEISPVRSIAESSDVTEFDEVYEKIIKEPIGRTNIAIKAYQKENEQFEQQRSRLYARDIMSSPVKIILESAPASNASDLLQKYGFRHLPVVSSNNIIIGMISDREIQGELKNKNCADIMIKTIIVAEEQTSIHELALILLNKKLNALPIVNHRREITGIITLSDILRYVVNSTPFLEKG